MVGFKHTLCALLLTMVTGMAIAQNNTNSPYTRYGYGDLSDQSFGNSKAMGGIASRRFFVIRNCCESAFPFAFSWQIKINQEMISH